MQRRSRRHNSGPRRLPGAAATCLLLVGCVTAPAVPPSAPGPAATPEARAEPDFDGDGRADLVVGTGERPGRVLVRYAGGATQELTAAAVGPGASGSSDFGQAILAHDLDGDGFTDLVVADPDPEAGLTLTWLRGSASGLDADGAVRTTAPTVPGAGRALALVTAPRPVLLVGGGSTSGSGVVLAYDLGADGTPPADPRMLTPGALGLSDVPGAARFGATLAATGSLLVIGAPGADVGAATRAGAVYTVDASAGQWSAVRITQDSPGVPDEAKPGDRFGAALSAGDGYVVVGAPGDDRDDGRGHNRPGAGLVQPFALAGHDLSPLPAIDERVLGATVGAGDSFGYALGVVRPCAGAVGVLVGAPARVVGQEQQAGSAWMAPLGGDRSCGPREFRDGAGLGAVAAANAVVGTAVTRLRNGADADTLVLAAQGNSEEGVAGRVFAIAPPYADAAVQAFGGLQVHEERVLALSPAAG